MIEVLGIRNADKIVPTSEDQKPRDPVSENMAILVGKPVKAFIYQDHDAHIATHSSFMQDPMIAQTIGQNPMAQQIMASAQAHIAEHLAFSYRKQIEDKLGAPLPAPDAPLPEEVEVLLAGLVAEAGKQLTQAHQQQAAQQQAQQQAQDPMFQLEQAKVQIQQSEVQRKTQKDQSDAQIAAAKLQLDKQRVQSDMQKEGMRVQSQQQQNDTRTRSQDEQAKSKLKLEAMKLLHETSKPQTQPKQSKE